MLRACDHSLLLTSFDPCRCQLTNAFWIAADGARADDRVVRLDVEIAHRSEIPGHANAARLTGGQPSRAPHHVFLVERRECSERWQARRATELLSGASLEIGGDEEGYAASHIQVDDESAGGVNVAAEEAKGAHTNVERLVERSSFTIVSLGRGVPPERGSDELRDGSE
jgi:hypothetical protein